MANFDKAFSKLIIAEGGYINDPNDKGGETFLGISRKNNPNWNGWKIIDEEKKKGLYGLNVRLKTNHTLIKYAKKLYKERYWDVLYLDDITNEKIAYQLFDTCVNCGKKNAILFAQRVLGIKETGKWSVSLFNKLINYE